MEHASLILVHLLGAMLWVGGAVAAGLFIVPAVLDAGSGGGVVLAGMTRRGFALLMTASGALVVASGLRLYTQRFSPTWVTTAEGIALSVGSLLGIAALFMGLFIQKPALQRLAQLSDELAQSEGRPSAEQAAEIEALQTRLGKIAHVIAWHVVAAAVLMASHRVIATLQ